MALLPTRRKAKSVVKSRTPDGNISLLIARHASQNVAASTHIGCECKKHRQYASASPCLSLTGPVVAVHSYPQWLDLLLDLLLR